MTDTGSPGSQRLSGVNRKAPNRIAAAALNSLKGGVVPRVGLEYITVGRVAEIDALLRDMDLMLRAETGLEVRVAKKPAQCVAQGLGFLLENTDILRENSIMFRTDDDIGEFERNRNL